MTVQAASRKILFVGPMSFNANSWQTRSTYILPDLLSALGHAYEIHMVTGPVPDFARKLLDALCERFAVRHIEILAPAKYGPGDTRWNKIAAETASTIRPDIITNVFGSQVLGEAVCAGAKACGARAVVRVAGDEIGSRKALGVYRKHSSRYADELRAEFAGLSGADTIIAMSPWEKERIAKIIGRQNRNKIKVCIRGVDLGVFSPSVRRRDPPRRFLYVGRKSAEKGYDVIEAAAKLLSNSRPDIEFVFVGDFEKRRVENCDYRGWVESADLPSLFAEVDAFILSSRTEGFPQVVAEAMAAGLPCVLSEHLFSGVFTHGEDVLLTSLDPEELAQRVLDLADNAVLSIRLAQRSRELAKSAMDSAYWSKRYADTISGTPFEGATPFDEEANKLRLLMVVPRPLGLLGTPGAYNLAEAFARHTQLHVICNPDGGAGLVPIVRESSATLPVTEIDFRANEYLEQILEVVMDFAPDIVHLVNWHGWVDVLPYLKVRYPHARYVIDFKTPLMQEGSKRDRIRLKGARASTVADLAMSRNVEDVESWIEGNQAPLFVYPLGVPTRDLHARAMPDEAVLRCTKFVYIGSFHEKRRLDVLIDYIAALPDDLKSRLVLDLYGSGQGKQGLASLIDSYNLSAQVRLHNALPQNELYPRLAQYDAGIAWVPKEFYDAAPSIKFLEYAGSGLAVLATDTTAHSRNIEAGFKAGLFSETPKSFANMIRQYMDDGVPAVDLAHNLELICQFDWDRIVESHFLPIYAHILGAAQPADTSAENLMIQDINQELQAMSAPVQFPVYWTPAISPFHSTRPGNKDTTVLGLLSERLFYGLRDECDLLPLTEQGWRDQLANTGADFLLIESCLSSVLGDWHFAQGPQLSSNMASMLAAARDHKLPIVIWITADAVYSDMYLELARQGDIVFAADPRMLERLQQAACSAKLLLPAIQPRLFNPLRTLVPEIFDFSPYLIAGCGLPETYEEIRKIVAGNPNKTFCGFERNHVPTENYVKRLAKLLPNYKPFGRVSHRMLPEVLKHARLVVTDARSRITSTEESWQALENAACMCRTLRLGGEGLVAGLSPYIKSFGSAESLDGYLRGLAMHDIALDAEALQLWRQAYSQDTFEQRLAVIKAGLGLAPAEPRRLVATAITPTMRPELVSQILDNFDHQKYAPKELIVVVNKDRQAFDAMRSSLSHRPEIKVCLMPNDQYAASSLNLGFQASSGDYVFRFDDDDFYGEHYLSDSMLMLQAEDADFLGKFSSFVKLNGSDTVYMRRQANPDRSLRTYAARDFSHKDAAVSGATFGVRADLLREYPFPDISLAAADTSYLELLRTKVPEARVVKTDCFGYTIGRDGDPTMHTWRVETTALIDKNRPVPKSNMEVPR